MNQHLACVCRGQELAGPGSAGMVKCDAGWASVQRGGQSCAATQLPAAGASTVHRHLQPAVGHRSGRHCCLSLSVASFHGWSLPPAAAHVMLVTLTDDYEASCLCMIWLV